MKIQVCIGSACHLKGSYNVIVGFQQLLEENNLTDKVQLEGAFCLGKCGNAVAIKIDDEYYNIKPEDCKAFFKETIQSKL